MLSVKSVAVYHGNKKLIGPVSFEVHPHEPLVIMGETGAGKSLIAQAVMQTLPAELSFTGEIYLNNSRIDNLRPSDYESLWGRSIAMLPQEPWHALDPLMSSFNQVFETHRWVAGRDDKSAKKATHSDFKKLSLAGAESKRPGQLSGGMAQRVAFAAAIAGGSPLLLADEPTKGLDSERILSVTNALNEHVDQAGVLIVITHDATVANKIGGQILVLREGNVVESGITHATLAKPKHAYTRRLIKADPQHWTAQESTSNDTLLLETHKLVAGRQGKALTQAIDLQLTRGRRVAITGASGSGKSTLLDTLAGLIAPVAGSFTKANDLGPTDIQKLYQDPPASFAPRVSLRTSLRDVARLHGISWQVIEELLANLGLGTELLDRRPDAVSGGELQRIAIARALSVKPKLLLADEPTSRLDPITQQETMALLAAISKQNQTAVLLVTHDKALASKWADFSIAL